MPNTAPAALAAALALAAEGWPVFLLGRTKRPVANCPACPKVEHDPSHNPEACECLTCHGFYAATTNADRLAAMVAAVPRGLLAIRRAGRRGWP
jgi:Bifunctional DNA primase/polymerase, N-terminal